MAYVIIGCSAAGVNAIEAIRSKDKKTGLIVISDEERPLYSRCLISYLLAGTIDRARIWYRTDDFFKKNKAEPILGTSAERIDIEKKEVYLSNKKKIGYEKLLLATGASPKLENIPGINKKGVFPLRTLDHSKEIESMLDSVERVAVLGGGLIGLRAAYALNNRGKKVKVFVRSSQILSQIIDRPSADIMQTHIERKGISIETGRFAKEITGKGRVEGVVLDNASGYKCELVIVGKGVRPNIDIAKEGGIKTDWGIKVDKYQKTSAAHIFAAGDAAESHDIALDEDTVNAIWPVACKQGRIAGFNMVGGREIYDGALAMNSIEFFGLPVISLGITRPKKDTYKEIVKMDINKNIYKKIVLRQGVIVGAIFVNSVDKIGIIGALIKNKVNVTGMEDMLLEDYFDYGRIVKLIKDSEGGFKEKEFRETVMTL